MTWLCCKWWRRRKKNTCQIMLTGIICPPTPKYCPIYYNPSYSFTPIKNINRDEKKICVVCGKDFCYANYITRISSTCYYFCCEDCYTTWIYKSKLS